MRMTSCTGSAHGILGIWRKSVETRRRTRRFDFLGVAEASRICAPCVPHEIGARWRSQHKRLYFSPCVETFNSKEIKGFRTWTKKSLRVFEFRDSYVLSFLYVVMNIRCPFHPFRTWLYLALIVNMVHLCSFPLAFSFGVSLKSEATI